MDDSLTFSAIEILKHPMVQVDYVSLASLWTGKELPTVDPEDGALLSAAVKIGNTRLIDNVILKGCSSKE
jgi:pantothenate synthetase